MSEEGDEPDELDELEDSYGLFLGGGEGLEDFDFATSPGRGGRDSRHMSKTSMAPK
jgi:hypothetical protein